MDEDKGVCGESKGVLYRILTAKARFGVWCVWKEVGVGGSNDNDDFLDPSDFLKKVVAM